MTVEARLRAFAKLNLGLRVLYRRPDGFHEIRTVFQTISLADQITLSVTRARTTKIEVHGTPDILDNLVVKASAEILEELKIQAHIDVSLKKHIPMGAGLGGGSTNAAAILLALPVLLRKRLPPGRLSTLAAQLGSDVPFFLYGGTALGLGRGEELYPLPELPDSPPARGLLVAPNVHSSTAEAYRDLSEQLTTIELQNKLLSFQHEIWRGISRRQSPSVDRRGTPGILMDENDFEGVVFHRHPELRKLKERLRRLGADPAAMTGSGSSVFGIFSDRARLEAAQSSFASERAFPISFMSRKQYRSAWIRSLAPHVDPNLWPPQSPYAR
jgi:4-diphosphocytidyl-2-C-methyl-D-erythritol kinase